MGWEASKVALARALAILATVSGSAPVDIFPLTNKELKMRLDRITGHAPKSSFT